MKLWNSLLSTGGGHVLTVSTFSGSVLITSEETTCPSNETSLFRNWHEVGFRLRAAVRILWNNNRRRCRCSSKKGAQIITSSRYARQCVEVSPPSARFINLVKLAASFVSLKGITLHWNCPRWVENAVWVGPLLLLTSANTQTPNPDRRFIGHHPALPRHHRSSVTVLHLSMYTNSVCGNRCTYGNFHVSLIKEPDCSPGALWLFNCTIRYQLV